MGGEHSGIGADTTTRLLEGAFWNPAVIQGKMRRLGFTSDAGYRFERGVDFEAAAARRRARDRADDAKSAADARVRCPSRRSRDLPAREPVRVARRASTAARRGAFDASDRRRLHAAAFRLRATRRCFIVTPPSYRFDLAIEEDFVEEVARIHGYETIPATRCVRSRAHAARSRGHAIALRDQARAGRPATGRRSSRSASSTSAGREPRSIRAANADPRAEPDRRCTAT